MTLDLKSSFRRVVTGDGLRKSRLHTCSGTRIDFWGLRYLPAAVASTFSWKAGLVKRGAPWLGYRALRAIDAILRSDMSLLEFGSGHSSLHFARRVGKIVSVEANESWWGIVRGRLAAEGFQNAEVLFRTPETYTELPEIPSKSVDFVVIDGLVRDRCVEVALEKLRPGGWMFLDNSDVPWDEFQIARSRLIESVEPETVQIFVDFHPYQIQVGESVLGRLPL